MKVSLQHRTQNTQKNKPPAVAWKSTFPRFSCTRCRNIFDLFQKRASKAPLFSALNVIVYFWAIKNNLSQS